MTFVDTNVLLDLVTDDPKWSAWSQLQLEKATSAGPVVINDIVYAEASIRYRQMEDLDAMLASAMIDIAPTPRPALFLAGKVFHKYRAAGGTRSGVLPDFFIGAHAAVAGWLLLTRDPGRYRTYFPDLVLITPDA